MRMRVSSHAVVTSQRSWYKAATAAHFRKKLLLLREKPVSVNLPATVSHVCECSEPRGAQRGEQQETSLLLLGHVRGKET